MDNNTPTAIPWWKSRIIWAQIAGILFALASAFHFDLGTLLGLDQEQFVAAVMGLIPIITLFIRVTHATPQVTGSKASAAQINREAANDFGKTQSPARAVPVKSGDSFGSQALKNEAKRPRSKTKK